MTTNDYATFREWFDTLASLFFRGPKNIDERSRMAGAYFSALEQYSAGDVFRGFEHLRDSWPSGKGMPAPSDWKVAMPRQTVARSLEVMTPVEMQESDEAERKGYEGGVCQCVACRAAGVTHQPIRYVPQEDVSGELLRRRHPVTGYEKILGVWIHGERLRNWYTARANFYEAFAKLKHRQMPIATVDDPHDERQVIAAGRVTTKQARR